MASHIIEPHCSLADARDGNVVLIPPIFNDIETTLAQETGLVAWLTSFRKQSTLLASTCLPSFNQAVKIGDSVYWDGGLTANPPLRPLVYQCDASDILIVRLQPESRAGVPRTVEEISTRFNEISFSSTLHSEIQGIALAKREAERRSFTFGRLERRLRRLNLHAIGPSASVALMDVASRLKTDARLLELLHSEGRAQANAWLAAHFDHIGVRSTLPLARHLRLAPA